MKTHPLSALDKDVTIWPGVEPPSDEDKRIDALSTSPFDKYLKRYLGDQGNQVEALMEFHDRRERCQQYLKFLNAEIKQGYINGLHELAFVAHSATQMLGKLGAVNADYVSVVAQDYGSWPMLCMLNTLDKEHQDFLMGIKLDHANIDGIPAHLIGPKPGASRKWAFLLVQAIQAARRIGQRDDLPQPLFSNIVLVGGSDKPMLLKRIHKHQDLYSRCRELPALGPDTVDKWWEIASALLLRIFRNKPWRLKELRGYVSNDKIRSLKNADCTKRAAVLDKIKSAFLRLAQKKRVFPKA